MAKAMRFFAGAALAAGLAALAGLIALAGCVAGVDAAGEVVVLGVESALVMAIIQ